MATFDALRAALLHDLRPSLVVPALRMELVLLRLDRSHRWRSERSLLEAIVRLCLRAYLGREPVIFTSILTPPELLHALGVVPFGLESVGAMASSLGLATTALAASEGGWIPPDSCTFLRAALGTAYLGMLPHPRATLCTSCLCDSTPKAFAAVARRLEVPDLLLDVPYAPTDDGVAYLAGQLKALAERLEELVGRRLEPARLAEAVQLSNQARSDLLGIAELRRAYPGLLDTGNAMGFIYPMSLMLGSPDGAKLFRSFHAELATAAKLYRPEMDRRSLLWLHLLPYHSHDLLAALEGAGAQVVFEEVNQVYWEELDPRQPFESLARKCITHYWNGPSERRIERLLALVRQHRVDGVVSFSHHGCRQSWGALRVVRDALAEVGVPLLELEGDCVDPRNRAEGQQRTRLEAFIETL